MTDTDPYRFPAGRELDKTIHLELFDGNESDEPPPYSTDDRLYKRVLKQLRQFHSKAMTTGETQIRGETHYFARYGSDPSTSTEVLSPSMALSVCRLALVIENQD